jgi:hypothetical protein
MTTTRFAPLVLLVLTMLPAPALAQPKNLVVGLYAPEIPFANPAQRYSMVRAMAQHLTSALGQPVTGKAYKAPGDLNADLRGKKVQFAVLGAIYAATAKVRVVAQAQLKSGTRWSIMAKSKVPISSLKGKVLQVPQMGPLTNRWVENGVLGSNVNFKNHFKAVFAPDVTSAISAVNFGRAAAVVAPVDTKGLVPLVGALALPAPAFAIVDTRLDRKLAAKATQAILSYGAAIATFQGWRAGGAGAYGAVAAAAQKKVHRMVLAAAARGTLKVEDLIQTKKLQPRLPRLEELFWVP